MDILNRFQSYAEAFELTYEDDNWSRLEEYFTQDAVYQCGPEDAIGRKAVLLKLQSSVNALDRKMDSRRLDFQTPTLEGRTLTAAWTVTYTKTGKPNLVLSGVETAIFEGNRIKILRDEFTQKTEKSMGEWMAKYGAML